MDFANLQPIAKQGLDFRPESVPLVAVQDERRQKFSGARLPFRAEMMTRWAAAAGRGWMGRMSSPPKRVPMADSSASSPSARKIMVIRPRGFRIAAAALTHASRPSLPRTCAAARARAGDALPVLSW